MKQFYFLPVFFLFGLTGFSQSLKELYNKSVLAYQDKNYADFLQYSRQLDSLRPSHPTYSYNLACAFALNGKTDEAVLGLKKCLLMNNTVSFEAENDLTNIKNTDQYQSLIDLKSTLGNPVMTSVKETVLSEKDLHPEGLLYLQKTKLWLVASVRNRKIVSFEKSSGKCSDWFTDSGLYSVMALKADEKEKILWVTSSVMPEMKGFAKSLEGKSEILKIDIKTRKLLKRFPLDGNHVLGDLVVDNKGNVYVSDSGEAVIFKIANDKLNIWIDLKKEAYNLQGLTFNDDGSELFIADYLKGILKINVKNPQQRHWLKFPENSTVKGIDGLLCYKKSLIAIHNGVKPIRIMKYSLNDKNEISDSVILDHNRPEFNEPALGTISGSKLYFFSNAPWTAYDKNGDLNETIIEFPALYSNQLP
ncbi:hypothetical protein NAT51_03295 [Flavobacterium amniphilum]|uniref:TPR end-of-group domain-containing protein n=1 Tax=Flavobacterium amniphilum TaxID=1834035 RepID=UPI00202AB3EF|nr:hypothetical protein [Flavobacterium amniphilum]MCL9804531.1 hypothetical protein [Flavobacterium amniphilum]